MSQPVAWTSWRQAVRLILRGTTFRIAWPITAIVGTLLTVVNQGAVIVAGNATIATWIRCVVNYGTPFTVSSIGYLSAYRRPR